MNQDCCCEKDEEFDLPEINERCLVTRMYLVGAIIAICSLFVILL
jgi:hypothetical protein